MAMELLLLLFSCLFAPTASFIFSVECYPLLICPEGLPVGYLDTPRLASTSIKTWMANISGVEWTGHQNTTLRCCQTLEEIRSRHKRFLVVRHPFTKLFSTVSHPRYCGNSSACSRAPLTQQRYEEFRSTATELIAAHPIDELDQFMHFQSQAGRLRPHALRYEMFVGNEVVMNSYDVADFEVLRLENLDAEWTALMESVCSGVSEGTASAVVAAELCKNLPPLPHHYRSAESVAAASVRDEELIRRVNADPSFSFASFTRFREDFALFSYSPHTLRINFAPTEPILKFDVVLGDRGTTFILLPGEHYVEAVAAFCRLHGWIGQLGDEICRQLEKGVIDLLGSLHTEALLATPMRSPQKEIDQI